MQQLGQIGGEAAHRFGEHQALVALVGVGRGGVGQGVDQRALLVLLVAGVLVQPHDRDTAVVDAGFVDLLGGHAHRLGQLEGGGVAAELVVQLLGDLAQAVGELLEGAGAAHEGLAIAEVVADVAGDEVDGVGLERGVVTVLVAVDGFEEADGAHLNQVVHRVGAPAGQAAGDLLDEGQVLGDQLLFLAGGDVGVDLAHACWASLLERGFHLG
ncbi:hypothetical protein D3C72_1101850 [compost metagenome]